MRFEKQRYQTVLLILITVICATSLVTIGSSLPTLGPHSAKAAASSDPSGRTAPPDAQSRAVPALLPMQQHPYLPPPSLRFDRITIEDGLSSSQLSCIFQDSQGFMWFGTQSGLNRYDGHSFTVYLPDPNDPSSLRDDFIESIHQDRAGVLWIGTQDGWIERYDREKDQFTHYEVSSHVYAIYEDTEGEFWIGAKVPGLLRFDRDTGETAVVWEGEDFTSILEDQTGTLWAASPEEGLGRYDRGTGQFTKYETPHPVHTLYQDRAGELWLATWGGGLGRFNSETEQFSFLRHDEDDPDSLSNDYISSIHEDRSGVLWVGTYQNGLDRYDRQTGRFTHYPHDPGDTNSLSSNTVLALYQDRSGVLWIGHGVGGGLSRIAAGAMDFGHYRHIADDPNSLSRNLVTSLYEDQDGVLWVGTGGGLDRWDRELGQWTHYRNDPDDPNSLSNDIVRSVYVDHSNVLWIGSEGGLDRYDRTSNQFMHYESPTPMWMDEGASGSLWLATKGGLYQLDRNADQLTLIDEGFAWKIMVLEDRSGILWVGSSGDGLDRYDPRSGEWRHYEHDPDDALSLSNDFVESIHEDSSGVLWLGTGEGLNRFDREAETFKRYYVTEGLPHNAVYGILEGRPPPGAAAGELWLSTGGGLSRFDPQTETFRNYSASDGLQSNQFWRNAYHQSPSGEMFFGGENGLNAFYPERITDNPYIPPVVITAFSLFNQVVRVNLPPDERIELTYKDNFLSFDFAALGYNAPKNNQYAYKLEGVDEEWVYAGTRRHADYPNLRPGHYTFSVKGSNDDGVWNEEGVSVLITIASPFWGTWWFRGIVALTLIAAAIGGYRLRVRGIEARSRELESLVQQRTAELEQEIHQRLDIEEALRQREKEQAIAAERNRLARDLHDSATQSLYAVTLYADAVTELLSLGQQEQVAQLVHKLRRTAKEAFGEMRLLIFELRPPILEEEGLAGALQARLEAVEGRAGLETELNVQGQGELSPDVEEGLYRIALEALNNALKHAQAQRITVSLQLDLEMVMLRVTDDGIGFEPTTARESGGLGLPGMAERAEHLGGQLTLESEPGMGTVVHVQVPNCAADGRDVG